MILAIVGDRECNDYSLIDKAINKAGLDITKIKKVISGGARGVDSNAKIWAEKHKIKFQEIKAEWDNLSVEGCVIKINQWGKKYNSLAGFQRNTLVAKMSDYVIAIEPNGPTPGTQDTIKKAKEKGVPVYIYEKDDDEYEYKF